MKLWMIKQIKIEQKISYSFNKYNIYNFVNKNTKKIHKMDIFSI